MTLPSNVGYGTVVGRFLLAYADGSDSDAMPDGVPAKGTIVFTPSPAFLKDASASPSPVTIIPAKVQATIDSSGYLQGPDGARGIRLVATNDSNINPSDWTWGVTFYLADENGVSVPMSGYSFSLPEGQSVDLTALSPVPSADGTFYLVGDTGKSAYELAVDNGFVGTEAEWLASLTDYANEILDEHIQHVTPHPAYDDIQSLTLIFENGLV